MAIWIEFNTEKQLHTLARRIWQNYSSTGWHDIALHSLQKFQSICNSDMKMLEFNNENISKQFCLDSTKIYRIDRTMYEIETMPSDTRYSLNNRLLRGVFPLNYFPIHAIRQFYSVSIETKSKLCDFTGFVTHASAIGKLLSCCNNKAQQQVQGG